MTSRDFIYWLQGFFELNNPQSIDQQQTEMIKKHLQLVFKHEIDPSMGDESKQAELNQIHNILAEDLLTEEEAIAKFGKKPNPQFKYNRYGWYDPKDGPPRC
ncbi:MAG TPA: hypothetical protein PK006_04585 [Saprospiraceae bacterium]|nr:hypothetical protein [Saprospiraceae bacterium]